MPQQRGLTDDDLQQLIADPNLTEADMTLLTPTERKQFDALKHSGTTIGKMEDASTGAVKGVGQTIFDLGKTVHNTPGVGNITDYLAKLLGGDPDTAFASNPPELEPKNTAQKVGKTAEQIGEFFIPAGAARKASIYGAAKMLPNTMKNPKLLNEMAAVAGRSVGEAGSAGAVSTLHGNENPEVEALTAGAGPLLGVTASKGLKALAATSWGRELIPILAASGIFGASPTALGFAGGMGTYSFGRKRIMNFMKDPTKMNRLATGARRTIETGARTGSALEDMRASRRKLEEQP